MRFDTDAFQWHFRHNLSQTFLNHPATYACRSPQDMPATFLLLFRLLGEIAPDSYVMGRTERHVSACAECREA